MAKTISLCSSPFVLGLLLVSILLMSSGGVNGERICLSRDLVYNPESIADSNWDCIQQCGVDSGPYTLLSYQVYDKFSFKPTQCACCWDDGN
ncbi:hypothetical protein MKW94_017569 [Papaver nudicaule]|uniref:Uncharacterized protein n=1 Tax=Papaver nudicaule TaxID=74823 RepID=A0AA41VKI0_PAPNU|nr:hypothetical protein [Papaver nudicaule]